MNYALKKHLIEKDKIGPWHKKIKGWKKDYGLDHDLIDKRPKGKKILPQQVIQALYKETKGKLINFICSI